MIAGYKNDDLLRQLEKPAYITITLFVASAYILIDASFACCESGTYTEAAFAFAAFSIVYVGYLLFRSHIFSSTTLVDLLDYEWFFTLINLLIWTAGIAILTFSENAVFNKLTPGYIATWVNFIFSLVHFAQASKFSITMDRYTDADFSFRVIYGSLLVDSLLLLLLSALTCLLGECSGGLSLGALFGGVSFALLIWFLVFFNYNPHRTNLTTGILIMWLIAVTQLTLQEPFFVDGEVVPNGFLFTWSGFVLALGLMNHCNFEAPANIPIFFSPHLLGFIFSAMVLLLSRDELNPFCSFEQENLNTTTNETFFTQEEKKCDVFDLTALVAVAVAYGLVAVLLFIKWYFGSVDAPDTLRKGGRLLLLIWSMAVFILTFPAESPFVFTNAGFASLWVSFGILFHLSWLAEETTAEDGGTLGDIDHFIQTKSPLFHNLRNRSDGVRNALYAIVLGCVIHVMSSIFVCVTKNEITDDPLDEEATCTAFELFAVALSGSTLVLMALLLVFYSKIREQQAKIFLALAWIGAGWVPLHYGPYDEIVGNGFFSTFLVIAGVVAFIALE